MQEHQPTQQPTGRLLDLDGVAEYLGLDSRTVRHLAQKDRIPVTRIDGRLRFDIMAIDRWIVRKTSKPGQAA